MIKVNCKKGKCKIKVDGSSKDIMIECAAIMIGIAGDLKKRDVSMREALCEMANFAADIYEGQRNEDGSVKEKV